YGVARVLFGGVKGAKAVAGLHRGAKGLRFLNEAEMVADVARLQQPSVLSGKVANMGRAGAALSGRMDAWRQLSSVTLAKKVNQQVLKLGFTSKLEQLIDADRGGQSVSHLLTEDKLAEQVYETFSNPLLDWGVDLFLYPTNIFTPGRFAKPAKAFVEQARKGFLKAADNQELTMAWYEPVLRRLEETEGAEAAKAFREAVKKKKLKGALRDHLCGGDEETMGAVMPYVTTMAAVDHAARVDASILAADVLEQLDSKTLTLYHEARDMLRGRLRYVDPDDIEGMLEHFAKYGLPDDESARLARSAREFWENRNKIAAAYMETVEEAAARGGAVPEGHIRFYGHIDTDTGEIVWRTSAPTAIPVSEALRRWDELPDDTLIEAYHSTTPELAERMLREGVKKGAKKKADYSTWLTGEGFYVGADPDRLRFLFGRQGPEPPGTPLGILVRKGDLADSPEALRMGLDLREALRDPLVGAQILDDIPAERI